MQTTTIVGKNHKVYSYNLYKGLRIYCPLFIQRWIIKIERSCSCKNWTKGKSCNYNQARLTSFQLKSFFLVVSNFKRTYAWIYIITKWVKRQKLLFTSERSELRLNSSKTFKKIGKKLKYIFIGNLRQVDSFKAMNRIDRDALWRPISRKMSKIGTWNFSTIVIQVFNLCY